MGRGLGRAATDVGHDAQSPHTEDEVHVVTAGRAKIETPGRTDEVGPGAVIFVPAGEEHRFTEVAEVLVLLMVFGPAYGSRSPKSSRSGAESAYVAKCSIRRS
ncbi:cupin domain-containing protein [Streptomyces sp. S584]|uniref:cupin domain-containing protein n=1 Tax=Streptomyces sp. S584 TaxID=3096010 RepID=UPI003A4D6888